jgi:hypothetical protein
MSIFGGIRNTVGDLKDRAVFKAQTSSLGTSLSNLNADKSLKGRLTRAAIVGAGIGHNPLTRTNMLTHSGSLAAASKAVDIFGGIREGRDNYKMMRRGIGVSQHNKVKSPSSYKEVNASLSRGARERIHDTYRSMIELEKHASWSDHAKSHAIGAGTNLAIAGAAGALFAGGKHLYSRMKSRDAWNKIKKNNPDFNNPQDRENFEVLESFAPDLAAHPVTARSYLERARRTGGLMPHEFVGDLVKIQRERDASSLGGRMSQDVSSAVNSGAQYASLMQRDRDFQKKGSLRRLIEELDPR